MQIDKIWSYMYSHLYSQFPELIRIRREYSPQMQI
jgi:hypothetical protein